MKDTELISYLFAAFLQRQGCYKEFVNLFHRAWGDKAKFLNVVNSRGIKVQWWLPALINWNERQAYWASTHGKWMKELQFILRAGNAQEIKTLKINGVKRNFIKV